MNSRRAFGLLALTALTSLGPLAPAAAAAQDRAATSSAIAAALASDPPRELRGDEWALVGRLYRRAPSGAVPAPLWLDGDRVAPRASVLAATLGAVDSIGLRPDDYPRAALRDALLAATGTPGRAPDVAALARADVLLTASFAALVDDLLAGRVNPREVEPAWHIATRTFDVDARIAEALDAVRGGRPLGDVLATLRTDYGVAAPLVQALARYRAIARAGGWQPMPNAATLRPGEAGPLVPALRRRLAAEGYPAAAGGDTLDAALAGALATFQDRHGLAPDSVLGPRTRAALDVPAERRVAQIEANLERLRWLPPRPATRFIAVNVPSATLVAFDGERRALTMRVVVGDELASRRTPIFADTLEFIQFGPYWNVPLSIALNEILPASRRDPGYLAAHHYEIVQGDVDDARVLSPRTLSAAALRAGRYRVRQRPGPDNALGHVKFMFPNDYAVYLHDTPGRARFAELDRALSHGCVRVEDPAALAAFVLHDRSDWPRERIAAALAAGRPERVNLSHGPPVYLVYLTAFGRAGAVFFRDDIYDRDDRLLRALAGRRRR